MARLFVKRARQGTAYVGEYLGAYLKPSEHTFLLGSLVDELGLDEKPLSEVIRCFLAGRFPDGRHVKNANRTEIDLTADGHRVRRVYDMEANNEKEVSISITLSRGPNQTAQLAALEAAMRRTFETIESKCIVARVGSDRVPMPAHAFALAIMEFHNRNGEPHVHLHVLIFAAVLSPHDGRVRQLDPTPLYNSMSWASALFTAELAANLNSIPGMRVTMNDKGKLEIAGVPAALADHWSSRRRDIVEYMARHGLTTVRESDIAAMKSRKSKEKNETLEQLSARAREEARALGFDPEAIEREIFSHPPLMKRTPEHIREGLAPAIESVVQLRNPHLQDLEEEMARRGPELGLSMKEIFEHARSAAHDVGARIDGWRETRAKRALETRLESLSLKNGVAVLQSRIERAIAGHDLSEEQREAVFGLTREGPALRILDLQERTATLAATADALRRAGMEVIGITHSRAAAADLHEAAQIATFTAAAANRQWARAEWRIGREPGAGRFRSVTTDPIQDIASYATGIISRDQYDIRQLDRWRAPLDLASRPHAVLIDGSDRLSRATLAELLTHIERFGKATTVILAGFSERARPAFRDAVAEFGAYPMLDYPEREPELESPFRFRPEPPPPEPERRP